MDAIKMTNSEALQYVYADIWMYLDELGAGEVARYMYSFPRKTDYNLVDYGSMRICYNEIRELYARAGYTGVLNVWKRPTFAARNNVRINEYKVTDSELWESYKRDVGHVARIYIDHVHKGA